MNTIVSIEKLYYGNVLTTGSLLPAEIKAAIEATTTKQITNVHDTTWTFEEEDPSTTDYNNQLNGQTYYRDSTPGAVTMNFSVGQYEFETVADLKGGTGTSKHWTAPETSSLIYKSMFAITKDGTVIVFPRADVSAQWGMIEDKVHGLICTATMMDTGVAGLSSLGLFSLDEIGLTV